jgi:hypothetical protein
MTDDTHSNDDAATDDQEPSLFDEATEKAHASSDQLGDDDHLDVFSFSGPIGRHTVIGKGAPLEYQVQPAILGALEDALLEMVHVDNPDSPQDVEDSLIQQLTDVGLHKGAAEMVAERTAKTLRDWQDHHGEDAGQVVADD